MPRHAFLSSTKQQLFYRTGWFARTIVCICQVVGPRHVLVGRKGGEGGVWYCTRSVHAHTQSAEPIEIFGTTHFVAARHRVRASHRAAFSFFPFLCVTCVAITYTGIFPIVLDCTTDIIRVCVCVSPKD